MGKVDDNVKAMKNENTDKANQLNTQKSKRSRMQNDEGKK